MRGCSFWWCLRDVRRWQRTLVRRSRACGVDGPCPCEELIEVWPPQTLENALSPSKPGCLCSLSLRVVSWSHFAVVAAPLAPSPSGRGLGRGDQFRRGCWFIDPLILSFSRREKGRKLLSLQEMMRLRDSLRERVGERGSQRRNSATLPMTDAASAHPPTRRVAALPDPCRPCPAAPQSSTGRSRCPAPAVVSIP